MITDRELARYISSNLHLYLADEDKPVECKVVDVSKNNGGTVAGVQILMHGVDHGPVISMETIRGLLDIGMPREEVMKNIAELVHKEENIILLNEFDPEDYQSMKDYLSVMVINTDVMDRICDIFPEGFTIIPSSIHEVMIVPGEDHDRYQELGEMVRSVNMTSAVSPEEVLSDRVYTYDRNSKSIHQVDESMYDKNCEQPEFKQSKSGMAQNNGLVYKEKQVDIEI